MSLAVYVFGTTGSVAIASGVKSDGNLSKNSCTEQLQLERSASCRPVVGPEWATIEIAPAHGAPPTVNEPAPWDERPSRTGTAVPAVSLSYVQLRSMYMPVEPARAPANAMPFFSSRSPRCVPLGPLLWNVGSVPISTRLPPLCITAPCHAVSFVSMPYGKLDPQSGSPMTSTWYARNCDSVIVFHC